MRATHGLNPFNLIQNMPYASPNLFQNHHADPASAALNPYAVGSRQLGFGCKSGLLTVLSQCVTFGDLLLSLMLLCAYFRWNERHICAKLASAAINSKYNWYVNY